MFKFDIIGSRKIWYTLSLILIAISIILLATFNLKLGIDFTGGSLLEITYNIERPAPDRIHEVIESKSLSGLIQPADELGYIIRLPAINEEQHQVLVAALEMQSTSLNVDNQVVENRFESFGPTLGKELQRNAIYALLFVIIAIILYLAYAFRKVARPVASWKFGAAAVLALIHDILIVVGLFSLLGFIAGVEVDSLFITALLTIMGFSVHDTIVTLDRVRENLVVKQDQTFTAVVNASINETITRSINTSVTTLFVLLAIYFFGGVTIKNFTLALIAGIVIGTYSSIFVAAPLLVTWYKLSKKSS